MTETDPGPPADESDEPDRPEPIERARRRREHAGPWWLGGDTATKDHGDTSGSGGP